LYERAPPVDIIFFFQTFLISFTIPIMVEISIVHRSLLIIGISVLLLAEYTNGAQLFSNSTIPTNLTVGCSNSLLSDVDCSLALMGFQHTRYYAETTLKRVCTPQCEAGLSSYEAAIRIACASETWKGFDDEIMPLDLIATNIRYEYNSTCLMDSGRYCNIIAAQAAASADPARMPPFKSQYTNTEFLVHHTDVC
jgi:hypothetical protein